MKKIILILIAIFFVSNVYAHSTKNINFDSKVNCSKKRSMLKGVTIGGEHMDEYMPQFINFFKENLL